MSLRVEERPVAQHMDLWHTLLAQTRDTPVDPRVLAWRYLENPDGVARAWVLVDGETGEVGGFTVVMPRRMRADGRELLAWIGADFSILPRFRALGPALQLRRAAREAIDRGEADVLYAFPNERMMLIHERAGHVRLGDLRRHAKPTSLRPHLARALRSPVAVALLAPPADAVWRLVLALRAARARDAVAATSVDGLDDRVDSWDPTSNGNRIAGRRTRQYLRWRYERQPGWMGGVLAARRERSVTGYLVFTEDADLLQISDLVAKDAAAAASLVDHATRLAGRRGRASISFVGLERGAWDGVLQDSGFRPREEKHAVFVYVPDRHAALLDARNPARWHLTVGDRDI